MLIEIGLIFSLEVSASRASECVVGFFDNRLKEGKQCGKVF